MHTFAEKPKASTQTPCPKSTQGAGKRFVQRHEESSSVGRSRWSDNRTAERPAGITSDSHARGGQLPGRFGSSQVIQAKLAVNKPGDKYEQEADRVSDQVMRMKAPDVAAAPPSIQRFAGGLAENVAARRIQRLCSECEKEESKQKPELMRAVAGNDGVQHAAEAKVDAVRGGAPMSHEQRAFFEPRFGADFSRVRIHTGGVADTAARSVGAHAYTRGNDVVFRSDQYQPNTSAGRHLIAHELTHVVQQGAAPQVQRQAITEPALRVGQSELRTGTAGPMLQRQSYPGDGMSPPGDCGWAKYLALRSAVLSAKAIVATLGGGCEIGDSCPMLAAKIAAFITEGTMRTAEAASCFRGGDAGHIEQIKAKFNAADRCYRYFVRSKCPPDLIAKAMTAVAAAEAAEMAIIAGAATAVVVALVVVAIIAIIALAEAIAAIVAGLAVAEVVAEAIAGLVLLLRGIQAML